MLRLDQELLLPVVRQEPALGLNDEMLFEPLLVTPPIIILRPPNLSSVIPQKDVRCVLVECKRLAIGKLHGLKDVTDPTIDEIRCVPILEPRAVPMDDTMGTL